MTEPTQPADYAQLELILWSLEGFLDLFVEDWRADAPVAKQPWAGNANECWDAIGQARVLCEIIERKLAAQKDHETLAEIERLRRKAKRVVVLPLWGWIALFGIELAASSNWGDAISASGLIILGIVNSRIRRNAHIDGSANDIPAHNDEST